MANGTARALRGHFMYEAYAQPIGQVGRFAQGAFGQPKGTTTAGGSIPYLDWLQLQMQWKSGVPGSDAWCQPGYNAPKATAACWQNCSQVFQCLKDKSGGTCDTDRYCRGDEPPPKRQRSPARERAVAGQAAARDKQIGGSGGSLEPPGPLLEPPGPLLTHLCTVYMA